jgi:hypothetical protein
MSIEIKASIRLVFKFDVLIKQKYRNAKFAFLFKVKIVSFYLLLGIMVIYGTKTLYNRE